MARRARRRQLGFNLDPCLDILFNTVGILVVITALALVSASDVSLVLESLPMLRETEKEPVFFECARGGIAPLDVETLRGRLTEGWPQPTFHNLPKLADMANARDVEDQYYDCRVEMEDFFGIQRSLNFIYELKDDAPLELDASVGKPGSPFVARLRGCDPGKQFAYFVVRPDGINAFRMARRAAAAEGFESGWLARPYYWRECPEWGCLHAGKYGATKCAECGASLAAPVSFGAGGVTPGVQ